MQLARLVNKLFSKESLSVVETINAVKRNLLRPVIIKASIYFTLLAANMFQKKDKGGTVCEK